METDAVSLRKSLAMYRGLVEVSALIASITEYDELLRAILGVARKVMGAEAATLFLLDEASGDLELTLSSHADEEFIEPRLILPKGRGVAGWVLEHSEAVLVPDAYADPRFYREADLQTGFRTRSMLCGPLLRDGRIIGVLQVLNPTAKPAFEPEDLEGFVAYASLTATAIDKLRALERLRRQERIDRDLAIASEMQAELLAHAIPSGLDGVRFAAFNRAAANVGGDFYDVLPLGNGRVAFAIGDVSGKGIGASLLMAQVLSAFEFVARATVGPAAALHDLNAHLSDRIVRGMFITALLGEIDLATGMVVLASAGHPPAVVVGAGGPRPLGLPGALPLGILPEVSYEQTALQLARGEWLVAYTDGLSESSGAKHGDFFDERIGPVAAEATASGPEGIVERLVRAEEAHRAGRPRRDDLTILVGGLA